VLVITHDDRFYHLADRVIKLDYGKVQANKTAAPRPLTSVSATG
jgi:putative ATP-binding cassette transporter